MEFNRREYLKHRALARRYRKLIHPEYVYLDLLRDILDEGEDYPTFVSEKMKQRYYRDRDVPYSRGLYGAVMEFDLRESFPLFTTKKTFFKGIITELLWLLRGSGNIKFLVDNNVRIWDEWGWQKYLEKAETLTPDSPPLGLEEYRQALRLDPEFARVYGDLGSAYPVNWRHFKGEGNREADQIAWLIRSLKQDKTRRHYVVSAWHPCYVYEMARPGEAMALPPCHVIFHFKVTRDNYLNCSLFQRSADMFLGVPFNVASYAALTYMIAHVVPGLKPGKFVHFLADYHIYSNHFEVVQAQLKRTPLAFAQLSLNPEIDDIDCFELKDFTLRNYQAHPPLAGEVALVGGMYGE